MGLLAQSPEDFVARGDAYLTEDDCYRLTEDEDYMSGSIWYKEPIDLNEGFVINLSVRLGCDDVNGADGMVFIFTTQGGALGWRGEGMGFAGIVPSLGIEIDTWLNEHRNDPWQDHISVLLNGMVSHYNDLAGPVIIDNIEDCERHSWYVNWKPETKKLIMRVDGTEVISLTYDLINEVFGGNTLVYWGVSSATGRYNNIHEVCFDRLANIRLQSAHEAESNTVGK